MYNIYLTIKFCNFKILKCIRVLQQNLKGNVHKNQFNYLSDK